MSELTDLEICKRIAEIECKQINEALTEYAKSGVIIDIVEDSVKIKSVSYNPLEDDALCFQLMIKYGMELTPMFNGCWSATVAKLYTLDEQIDYQLGYTWSDANPNRAICLAIIEDNKE